eukprot:2095976-Rhodomonas_salina.3
MRCCSHDRRVQLVVHCCSRSLGGSREKVRKASRGREEFSLVGGDRQREEGGGAGHGGRTRVRSEDGEEGGGAGHAGRTRVRSEDGEGEGGLEVPGAGRPAVRARSTIASPMELMTTPVVDNIILLSTSTAAVVGAGRD